MALQPLEGPQLKYATQGDCRRSDGRIALQPLEGPQLKYATQGDCRRSDGRMALQPLEGPQLKYASKLTATQGDGEVSVLFHSSLWVRKNILVLVRNYCKYVPKVHSNICKTNKFSILCKYT